MSTFSVTLTDGPDVRVFKAESFSFSMNSTNRLRPEYESVSMVIDPSTPDEARALVALFQTAAEGDPYDTVTVEVRNDSNQLVHRWTLTWAYAVSLNVGGDQQPATARFIFEKITLDSASTPGGALNKVYESSGPFTLLPEQDGSGPSGPVASSGGLQYELDVGGQTLTLTGYELGASRTYSADGVVNVGTAGGPLIAHFGRPAEDDAGLLFGLLDDGTVDEATLRIRDSNGELVQQIALSGVRVQAQATADGGGSSRSSLALTFDRADLVAVGELSNPDVTATLATSEASPPGTFAQTPATLAGIGPAALLRPDDAELRWWLSFGTTERIALTGVEFDFARAAAGEISPFIIHLASEDAGDAGSIRLLESLAQNVQLGMAVIELRTGFDELLTRVSLAGAYLVTQSIAGGGAGGDVVAGLAFSAIEVATAATPGAPLDSILVADLNDFAFQPLPPNLGALATIASGGGYTYRLTIDGRTLAPVGFELDIVRHGSPDVRSSPLMVRLRDAQDADLLAVLKAIVTTGDLDAKLEILDSRGDLIQFIRLEDITLNAFALATGTGRDETTLALGFAAVELESYDAAIDAQEWVVARFDGQSHTRRSAGEFAAIADSAQARQGGNASIELVFQKGPTLTAIDLTGYELDFGLAAAGLPLVVHSGGAPGDASLIALLNALTLGNSFDLALIEVRDKDNQLTQRVELTNPRIAAQSLAAGGKGLDGAMALLYDEIDFFGATVPGTGDGENYAFAGRPVETLPDLNKLTDLVGGDSYSYTLVYNDESVPILGYEIDVQQPQPAQGAQPDPVQIKSVVVHLGESAGDGTFTDILFTDLLDESSPDNLRDAAIEVRDGNGALVSRILMTGADVQGVAHEQGVSGVEAVIAFSFDAIEFQDWDPGNPGATSPVRLLPLTVNTPSQPGDVDLVPVPLNELAAKANAANPGWVDTLIGEVQDFFTFIREEAPQRALGLDDLPVAPIAPLGFSAMSSHEPALPALEDIPIIGDKLLPFIENGLDIFRDVEARIIEALNNLPDSEDAATALADQINGLGIDGLEAEVDGASVRLVFSASDAVDLALGNLAVSLGTDRFGFDLMADVGAKITGALNASLLVDVATGAIEILDNGLDELSLALEAGADFTASGGLGFLNIDVTDNNPGTDEIKLNFGLNVGAGRVQDLGIDDITLSLDGSARLDVHIVTGTPISILPTIAADLVVDWTSSAIAGEGLTTEVAFNDVTLDLRSLLGTLAEVFKPIIDVYDTFPIGVVLDAMVTPLPIIDSLARKIGVTSLFDVVPVGSPDGVLNLLDVAVIALRAQGVPDDDSRIVSVSLLAQAIAAINSADGSSLDDLGLIELGSYRFVDPADSSSALSALGAGDGKLMAAAATADSPFEQTETPTDTPADQASNKIRDSDAFKNDILGKDGLSVLGGSPFANGFNDVTGFSIPLLEGGGENVIKLLFNAALPDDPVTIIQYDLPALEFASFYEQYFPIVGPIAAVLRGGFEGRIDFAIGYDTAGLARDDLTNLDISDFAEGFFITTQEFTPGSGQYEPIATISAGIEAFGAVNVGVAAAGVGGGIVATVSAFLSDPDMDGKFRLSDLEGGCLFDPISGKLTAQLSAFIKFGYGPFSWTRRFKIADATLIDFSFGCDGPSPEEMGGLATLGPDGSVPAGTLQLNVGSRAGLRNSIVPDYRTDIDEHFAIRNAVDENGVLIPGALQVAAFTVIETFGADPAVPVDIIKANFGADDDSFVIAADVMTPSEIRGEAGNDLLLGGGGSDTLHGDAGEDILSGNGGNDRLFGGADDDTLEGGPGADHVDGGEGTDQVSYELSPVGVIFRPIADVGGHSASRGQGGDAEGDTLISIEYIIGSRFDDQLYGNEDRNNTLEGIEGNDILRGGSKDDYILGGPGADLMFGFSHTSADDGGDRTSYLTANGGVRIDLATGQGKGSDAEGDRLVGMEHVQGSSFDDVLRGNGERNRLEGRHGDDILEGRGGEDIITGLDGDDIVYALADGDSIDGGSGHDLLSYANRTAGGVTVNLASGDGGGDDMIAAEAGAPFGFSSIADLDGTDIATSGDHLTGDFGDNRIRGLAGADSLLGNDGEDTLVGGAGADALNGGVGRDLADYLDSPGAVTVNLATGQGSGADAQGDTLAQIEDLRGSDFIDWLTGDAGDNRIDPSLSRGTGFFGELVFGGAGTDTLKLDYSRGDIGKGLEGGYDLGSAFDGSFTRELLATSALLDRGNFFEIEKLHVIGTFKDDIVYGGGGDDRIITGSGDDIVYGGGKGVFPIEGNTRLGTVIGADFVLAGDGDDSVLYGTNENRLLARDILSQEPDGSFGPFLLDGGRGIDTLSISLAHLGGDIILAGSPAGTEFRGTNYAHLNGSHVANFEILGSVFTGAGNDRLTQLGDHDNVFETGAGIDIITPGIGVDEIDGGTDFSSNFDGGLSIDFVTNPGDLLILDYSTLSAGVSGDMDSVVSSLSGDPRLTGFRVNVGSYRLNDDRITDFEEIERVEVTGTGFDDTLFGTQNFAQNRRGSRGNANLPEADSSQTLRGADKLFGLDGDDIIIGNTGNDIIDGGDGDDTLTGTDPDRAPNLEGNIARPDGGGVIFPGGVIDQTEIDVITGGAGADLFVLGIEEGFFYANTRGHFENDVLVPDAGENRAIITDFNPDEGDRLQLYGDSSFYSIDIVDSGDPEIGSTANLYFDEPEGGRRQWIAELQGVDGLDLDGTAVVYVDQGAQFGSGSTQAALADADEPTVSAHLFSKEPVEDSAPIALTTAANWITQNNDPASLRDVLLEALGGSAIDPASLTIELDGHGEAFGTFDGDPFGLGSGFILSTGKVEDLQGANTEDGGFARERFAEIEFVRIGRSSDDFFIGTDIYRADLSGLGFDIASITLPDSNSRVGGSGGYASGFDLDNVILSRALIGSFGPGAFDVNNQALLPALDVFDFSASGIILRPGTMRFTSDDDFEGARNGIIIDPGQLATRDGTQVGNDGFGFVTLGDGGVISFNLTEPVSTDEPLYLYIGEYGGAGETITGTIRASDQRIDAVADLSTDFGVPAEEHDTTTMTFSFDKLAGSTDDMIVFNFVMFTEELAEFSGSAFNDTVKITLNGENLAQLSGGYELTVNNLLPALMGVAHPDLILNRSVDGPLADQVSADAFTKTLTFAGQLQAHNIITIEVRDIGDGTLDTGVLVRAGTAASGGGLGNWTILDANDAPVFTDLDGVAAFNAGDPAVALDTSASAFDAELGATGNYAGASLTLSRLGGADARDIFGSGGIVSFAGATVFVGAAAVGTVQNAGGVLSVLFNASADQAAVNSVVSSLTYRNSAPLLSEDVHLLWQFSDGNSGGAQGLGGPLSAIGATTVLVRGGNGAPTAAADALNVDEDATTANLAGLLLGNDADPDIGDSLSIVSVNATATLGTVVFDPATQSLTYRADHASFDALEPGDIATTSFSYIVRDAAGATSGASVAVTINGLLNDDDYIYGTIFNDVLTGTAANEKFRALSGNDVVRGGGGNDRIEAQEGNDVVYGGSGHNLLFGEAGNDTFGNETVQSTNLFDGGAGVDTLITRASVGQTVTVDLVAGTVANGFHHGSTLVDVENVKNGSTNTAVVYLGDDEANALTGGLLADILRGRGGKDVLQGSSGHDMIDGGPGADMLGGGLGNDVFVLRAGETHGDRILDFAGGGGGPGDMLRFEGFAPGATLSATANRFTITHSGGSETFTMNTTALHISDYGFFDLDGNPAMAAMSAPMFDPTYSAGVGFTTFDGLHPTLSAVL